MESLKRRSAATGSPPAKTAESSVTPIASSAPSVTIIATITSSSSSQDVSQEEEDQSHIPRASQNKEKEDGRSRTHEKLKWADLDCLLTGPSLVLALTLREG